MGYHRLSPFSALARQSITEIYQDLAKSVPFNGILFHDDVTLSDYEDASPKAKAQYAAWGLPNDLNAIRGNEALLQKWTGLKTRTLDDFALLLAAEVRKQQPSLLTARNLYAQVALQPYAENWYAQSLENSLRDYDFTAIMAMPYMEQVKDPATFYKNLVSRVKSYPQGLKKTVFELQAKDWRTDTPVSSKELADTISTLYLQGVQHVGYYPDDPIKNHPDPMVLRRIFDSKSSAALP
jgi:biofilm PGA synthesis lipoprotein PgaB